MPRKRKPGRPKGSKNKVKTVKALRVVRSKAKAVDNKNLKIAARALGKQFQGFIDEVITILGKGV